MSTLAATEEREVILSIYDSLVHFSNSESGSCTVRYTILMDPIASINIYLPHDYPFDTPVFELCVDWLSSDESTFIMTQLEGIVESEVGEVILFQIISWLREYFDELLEAKAELELTGRLVAENDIEIENGDAVNVVSVSPPKSITPKLCMVSLLRTERVFLWLMLLLFIVLNRYIQFCSGALM